MAEERAPRNLRAAPSIPPGARREQGSCVTGHARSDPQPPLSHKGTRDTPVNDSCSQNARRWRGLTLVLLLPPLPVPSCRWRPLLEGAGQAPGVRLHPSHFLCCPSIRGPCPACRRAGLRERCSVPCRHPVLSPFPPFVLQECSLFYSKRFCLPCVQENVEAFPQEIRQDLERRKRPSKKPASQPGSWP